jgi:hypothetical protein
LPIFWAAKPACKNLVKPLGRKIFNQPGKQKAGEKRAGIAVQEGNFPGTGNRLDRKPPAASRRRNSLRGRERAPREKRCAEGNWQSSSS